MITRAEAEKIVLDGIHAASPAGRRAVVLDVWLRPYGWVVFYDSEKFVETGNDFDRFFGNGPKVVTHDQRVHALGTARSAEEELAAFERDRGLSAG